MDIDTFLVVASLFVSQHTGLPIPEEELSLIQLDHCVVQAEFNRPCSDDPSATHVVGMYEEGTKKIILSNRVDPSSLHGQATIVHEMVHYFQDRHGLLRKMTVCETEKQAYETEYAYLESLGVEDIYGTIGLHQIAYIFLTNCSREHY